MQFSDQKLSRLISYYKFCYQADNRETQIQDFFSNKVEHSIFLDASPLLQGMLDYYPVNSDWGSTVEKQLQIYAKEKELILCIFFLVGTIKSRTKQQRVCAPLFINSASIFHEDEIFSINLEQDSNHLNPSIFTFLKLKDNSIENPYDLLNASLPKGQIGFEEIVHIQNVFGEIFQNVDCQYLDDYPHLFDKPAVETMMQNPSDTLKLIPATGLGILRKSHLSRGVLNELDEMTMTSKHYSRPLRALFLDNHDKISEKKTNHYVPANLSVSQQGILDSIDTNISTLVIGPPGTGKSFTIASIAIDAMSKGKSVLIASKTDQAVDVVLEKIENDFGIKNIVVRGGRKDYKKKLKQKIENLLSGIGYNSSKSNEIRRLRTSIDKLLRSIDKLEHTCKKKEIQELKRSKLLAKSNKNIFDRIRENFIKI